MGLFSHTCPVCGHEILFNGYQCRKCGFELHVLPEAVSSTVRKYEEERLSIAKKVWEEHLKEKENSVQKPYGYLVQFRGSEAQNVYALSLGKNIFGTEKGDKAHHQVALGELMKEHFVIEINLVENKGKQKPIFSISPLEGSITIDNPFAAPMSTGTEQLSKNQDVYAGGLKFRLLGNKQLK